MDIYLVAREFVPAAMTRFVEVGAGAAIAL
jgi:hypothetical protein